MKLVVQFSNGNHANIPVDRIEREGNFVIAYRELMGATELAAIIALGAIDYLYLSEVKS